ncbi:Flp pilus assembly protein CpaB [Arthrobacter sp. CAN_A1]|uniref:Flp pilus assembly protein CpaB n=1 Tax=Arthrobacter sp. CAN_A1 TaxID=2787717 RepID=UPI0018C9C736
MKTRIIGAIIAVLLATVGAVFLVSYVQNSEERAFAGTETAQVLIVRDGVSIPEGTPAEDLLQLVSQEAIPAKVVSPGAIASLDEIAGRVTSIELVPGEQLLSTRFINPDEVVQDQLVVVPEGMQEVTIQLELQRVAGGRVAPGDTVGVLVSQEGDPTEDRPSITHLTMHKVLVTNVQGSNPVEPDAVDGSSPAPVPEGSILVTLARTSPDVEEIVFAQEFGRIWLTREPATASEDGARPVTSAELFQ